MIISIPPFVCIPRNKAVSCFCPPRFNLMDLYPFIQLIPVKPAVVFHVDAHYLYTTKSLSARKKHPVFCTTVLLRVPGKVFKASSFSQGSNNGGIFTALFGTGAEDRIIRCRGETRDASLHPKSLTKCVTATSRSTQAIVQGTGKNTRTKVRQSGGWLGKQSVFYPQNIWNGASDFKAASWLKLAFVKTHYWIIVRYTFTVSL